jgi:Phage integrase family
MLNWGVRMGYLERNAVQDWHGDGNQFGARDSTICSLRERRRLTATSRSANPHLRGVIIAMLDTACRLGELLSLQWKNVNLKRRELLIEGHKATRTARILPISSRPFVRSPITGLRADGTMDDPADRVADARDLVAAVIGPRICHHSPRRLGAPTIERT